MSVFEERRWLARVESATGSVVGGAFAIDGAHLLTCAHVVEAAGGRPGGAVTVRFLLYEDTARQATVLTEGWVPADGTRGDVAVLRLEQPPGAAALPLHAGGVAFDARFGSYGFPAGYDDSVDVDGRIGRPVGHEWLRLAVDQALAVQPGFSGAPVWVPDLGAAVGMIVTLDEPSEGRVAFCVPIAVIAGHCPVVRRLLGDESGPHGGNSAPAAVSERMRGQRRGRAAPPPPSDASWDVFIAYPSAERSRADELYDHLYAHRKGNVRVFLDFRCLAPGAVWPAALAGAQSAAAITVVLVSAAAGGAFYHAEEIARGIALARDPGSRHRVVPVWLDETAAPPYGLRIVQGLSLAECGGMSGVAAALARLLTGCQDEQPSAVPSGPSQDEQVPPRGSPFRPGRPLYAGDRLTAASRRALLDVLVDDVRSGGNVNLVGERRLGRTTMLNHLCGRLLADDRTILARVNLQDGIRTETDFYGAVLWELGRYPAGAARIGDARCAELEACPSADYTELRAVLRDLRQDRTALILVDEFERCFDLPKGLPFPAFFDNVRSLLGGDHEHRYAGAVVATREPLARYFTRMQVTSTLPGYLPPRRLELLDDDDVEEVLAQPSPHRLGRAQRDHAAHLSAGHPCHLQAAGESWYRALEGARDRSWAEAEFDRLAASTCFGAMRRTRPSRPRRAWSAIARALPRSRR